MTALRGLPGAASLRSLAGGLLDLIYPPRCLVCERYDTPSLCETCSAAFTPIPDPLCGTCGRPVEPEQSGPCRTCDAHRESVGGDWAFDSARSAGIFEGSLRLALHRLKYTAGESLGLPLGAYLANRVAGHELFSSEQIGAIDSILAVPMHPLRERSRGFNQASLLAAPVAEILGVPLLPPGTVRRTRRRPAQVGLSQKQRRQNVKEAFVVPEREAPLIAGKQILIIDDVFTTGATVNACASALRDAGAARILVATLAGGG
jgi:ComF family protein